MLLSWALPTVAAPLHAASHEDGNQTYCQVHFLGWCSRQLSHGGNVVPALTSFCVSGYCVHSTLPVLGTVRPGCRSVVLYGKVPFSETGL